MRGTRRDQGERSSKRIRQSLADEAARLLEHQGTRNFELARRKAGARLGINDERMLPTNEEIESALRARQSLFAADSQPRVLRQHRESAVAAMEFLRDFDPRVVGATLDGTADAHSTVCLHLFHDDVLALIDRLTTSGVEFDQRERRMQYASGSESVLPVFQFEADGVRFDVALFGRESVREAPLDPVHRRPQRRAARAALLSLIEQTAAEADTDPSTLPL